MPRDLSLAKTATCAAHRSVGRKVNLIVGFVGSSVFNIEVARVDGRYALI